MEGWIRLHRKFSKWEWFNISEMVHLFIYLILNANHTKGTWRGIELERGQILTGLKSLNEKTKISYQTLRTCLKRLKKTGEINIQPTNKFSIITICNYDSYQINISDTNNKLTNNQQTTNKQLTTNNNKKNKKNNIYNKIYFENTEINELFIEHLKIREKVKAQNTERGIKILEKKLRDLSDNNKSKAIKLLENAILGNWKTYYPLNNE